MPRGQNAGRSGTLASEDGHRYRLKSKAPGKSYYVCCGGRDQPCKGRGYILDGTDQIVLTTPHSHTPVIEEIACKVFKDELWAAVVSSEEDHRMIYDRIASDHAIAASIVTFASIERSMGRWRHESHPPMPETLQDFADIINREEWAKYREYSQGTLTVRTINVNATTTVTICADQNFLASRDDIQELHIDATYKVCPKQLGIYQLLTIMGRIDDATVPLAWALMTRKTEEAYEAVFHLFKHTLAPNISPTVVYQDFETAIRNAIKRVYPNIRVVHCWFHLTQALLKRFKKKKGRRALDKLRKWDSAKVFYRKMCALPLLPAAEIVDAFRWLINNTAPDVRAFFADLIEYFQGYWLETFTPDKFSVYRSNERTNNRIESYHRVLNRRLGVHPRIWQFIARLKNLQSVTRMEVTSLDRGNPVRRPVSQANLNRESVLNRLWELHENGSWNMARFFACANHVSPAFSNQFVISSPQEVDMFLTAEAHNIGAPPPNNAVGAINLRRRNALERIPIQHMNVADRNVQILILEDLNQSLCPGCRRSILDVVSYPCGHWFLCQKCTESLTLQAFQSRAALVCGICQRQCVAFKTLRIS